MIEAFMKTAAAGVVTELHEESCSARCHTIHVQLYVADDRSVGIRLNSKRSESRRYTRE